MSEERRANLTGGIWFFSAIVLAALFISAVAQGELTVGHIFLALVILGVAVAGTVYLPNLLARQTDFEKTKRRGVDSVLSEMTADEIIELKRRLSNGNILEENIVDYIGDDGELV